MREALMTAANEAYAEHFDEGRRKQPVRAGFDGWLTAVRAFFLLVAGLLLISLFTMV